MSFAICHPSADQTPCSWNLPTSSRAGGLSGLPQSQPCGAQSAQGQPWAGRAVTCPGANPGPGACPDLPPAGSCSWEMAAVLLDWARPSQHQGMEGYSWDCSSLACVLQGLGRRNCGSFLIS